MIRNLTNSDYKSLTQIVQLEAPILMGSLRNILQKHYTTVKMTRDYLYAIGDIPIALVAHLDTVFPTPPAEVFFDRQKGVLWSPTGAGFDDRAGVFLILKVLAAGYKPHIIFTTGEEIGAIGAANLVRVEKKPFAPMKYIIQLDRRGTNDCVFYDCDNKEFVKYVSSFGFIEAFGSFTDISEICPAWGVAGVNLSIGYRDEHSESEVLFVNPLLNTLDKVEAMLDDAENSPNWKYIRSRWAVDKNYFKSLTNVKWDGISYYNDQFLDEYEDEPSDEEYLCHKCGKPFTEYEMFPVKTADNTTVYYCPDCISDGVTWCTDCGEAFETTGDTKHCLCADCKTARENRWKSKLKTKTNL